MRTETKFWLERALKVAAIAVIAQPLMACATDSQTSGDIAQGAAVGAAGGVAAGAVIPGVSVIEGAAVGAAIGGLAGAVWADQNNDGYVDGYVSNGQYYTGTPQGYDPTLRRVATGALGGAALGAAAGAVIPSVSLLEGAVIGAAVGGLAGAVWADRDYDGRVDGYVQNGQYYAGAPSSTAPAPTYTAPAHSGERGSCDGAFLSLSPPQPSAQPQTLDDRIFRRRGSTLNTVAGHLVEALRGAGYQDHSFYCVPGGFALATAIERIRDDKRPWPGDGRWKIERRPLVDFSEGFTVGRFLEALKDADPGTYRMILFYVTDRPLAPLATTPGADFRRLPRGGPDELREPVGRTSYSANYRVKALVYEFRRRSVGSPAYFVVTTLPTETHLQRSGILGRLRR